MNVIPGQPLPVEDLTAPDSPNSPPPPLADMFDHGMPLWLSILTDFFVDLFAIPGGPDMVISTFKFYDVAHEIVL